MKSRLLSLGAEAELGNAKFIPGGALRGIDRLLRPGQPGLKNESVGLRIALALLRPE
jgi:hypothetical protein